MTSPECSLDRRRALLFMGGLLAVPWAKAAESDSTIFVAGSSGATGRRVVQELRKRGFTVRAGVRDVPKAQSLGLALDSKVKLVEADVTKGSEHLANAIGDAKAVVCTIGSSGFGPGNYDAVDRKGTMNLVDAAVQQKVEKFILMSSLLTNGAAAGQLLNPGYVVLNLFGGVLTKKLEAENYLRKSGLTYTIVRPGGLKNASPAEVGNLIVGKEDTLFGRKEDPGTSISRDTVAEVLVEALLQGAADNRVIEIVSSPKAPRLPADQWFVV